MTVAYREWLIEMLVIYGDRLIDTSEEHPFILNKTWNNWNKAFEMNHIIYFDDDEGRTIGYQITPKAAKYLERYSG